MSATDNMTLTYKRKRLSSCSSPVWFDVFSDLCKKAQAVVEGGISEDQIGGAGTLGCVTCGSVSRDKHVCSGRKLCFSSMSGQIDQPNKSEADIPVLPQNSISREVSSDMIGEKIPSSLPLENIENTIAEDDPLYLKSGLVQSDKHIEGRPDSQLVPGDIGELPVDNPSPLYSDKLAKTNLTTPLITFNRRLKRKADSERVDVLSRLLSASLEENSDISKQLQPAADDTDTRRFPSETGKNVSSKVDDSNCCSCSTMDAAHVTVKLGAKEVCTEVLEHNALLSAKASGTTNQLQSSLGCLSSEPVVVSSCNDNSNEAPSGNSQLTSSDGTDSKVPPRVKEKRADALVIDCNVAPEPEYEEQMTTDAPVNLQHSNPIGNEIVTDKSTKGEVLELIVTDKSTKGEVLELFKTTGEGIGKTSLNLHSQSPKHGSTSMGLDGSRLKYDYQDVYHMSDMDLARSNKYLQLYSEENTIHSAYPPESITNGLDQRKLYALGGVRHHQIEQSYSRAPSIPQFFNVRSRDSFGGHSMPDHTPSILRHKMMLESINSRANAIKVEASQIPWTEDELDYLWIGVRRHGRGNWFTMLRDPRLHFCAWRTPRDLTDQWELEQHKLLNETGTSQSTRYLRQQLVIYPERNNRLLSSRAEPQLSLGDVDCRNEASMYKLQADYESYLSKGKRGIYNGSFYSEFDGRLGAVHARNVMPHWLQESSSTQMPSRDVPPMSQAGPSSRVQNIIEPDMRREGMQLRAANKPGDPIVIDSDASSEETISDGHNPKI